MHRIAEYTTHPKLLCRSRFRETHLCQGHRTREGLRSGLDGRSLGDGTLKKPTIQSGALLSQRPLLGHTAQSEWTKWQPPCVGDRTSGPQSWPVRRKHAVGCQRPAVYSQVTEGKTVLVLPWKPKFAASILFTIYTKNAKHSKFSPSKNYKIEWKIQIIHHSLL